MFCYLAVLIYLCGEVGKKGCQGSCSFERNGNESKMYLLILTQSVCKMLSIKFPMGKIHKNAKTSCQITLFSSKSAAESLNSYTVFSF